MGSSFILLHEGVSHLPRLLLNVLFPSIYVLSTFVENHLAIAAWVYFSSIHSLPLVYFYVFMPTSCCLGYCSFVACFEVKLYKVFFFVLCAQALTSQGFCGSIEVVDIYIFFPVRKVISILMRITLNLYTTLGSVDILTIFILSVYEH